MVQVRVRVSHLAIDTNDDGVTEVYVRGQVFDCPTDRAARLGNSITILDVPATIPEPEPNPPDIVVAKPTPEKSTSSKRRK